MWKRSQRVEACQYILDYLVGGVEIILGDEIPNLIKINRGVRVEIIAGHEPGGDRRAALFSRNRALTSSPETGLTLPLFRAS
jgi:hypothetical protein